MKYKIVEKENPLAVHAICSTLAGAEYWIKNKAPEYVKRGFFMDKTLTENCFEIKEYK